MSHAEHFLQRLARLADDHVRLALDLYHDPAWVRTLLARVGLGDHVERVAISLDDPCEGPFVIVTRGGDFVTCLARGMSPGQRPVVTRAQVDAAAVASSRERDKQRLLGQLDEPDARMKALFRRLFAHPDEISREDFVAVAAWEPLLGAAFFDTYRAMGSALIENGEALRRGRIPRRDRDELLHGHWNLLHATGHMALLGSMSADAEQRLATTEVRADVAHIDDIAAQVAGVFSFPLVGTGVSTFMVKGSWAAGRVGKPLLSAYKRALSHDVAFFELVDTLLALLCIGRRSSKLRVEIAKAIRAAPGRAENDHARRLRAQMGREVELICQCTADFLEGPEDELADGLRRVGFGFFDANVDRTDPTVLDIADTMPLMARVDGITDGRKLVATMGVAAAAARLPAERFYLPREVYDTLREPWTPEDTLRMLDPVARLDGARTPAKRDASKVSRNAPCPCGSGQKYKRCCART